MTYEVSLIATAAMGLEAIVANEIRQLGYKVEIDNGKVNFNAPLSAIPRCNLWLRSADRLKVLIGEFPARTFDELYESTKQLPWENFINENGKFPVSGKSNKSKLYSVPDCQSIVKKAIADRLMFKYGIATKMPETGSLYKIEVAIHKDTASLTIDTSGAGLHKRGYRINQGEAPLRETLAAALVMLTNWKPEEPFIDPFCGSGTIPIEAALIGQNIAPGFNREFVSEEWDLIKDTYWEQALEEVEDKANYDQQLNIIGSDIDHNMINIAANNAIEAGLGDLISWKQMQVADLNIQSKNGYLVTNPPYGLRIGNQETVNEIYNNLGSIIEQNPSWSFYILTAFKQLENTFGKKATRRRKLFNAFVEAHYYQYFGKKV